MFVVPPRNDVVGAEVPDEGDEGDKTMNPAQIGGWWSGPPKNRCRVPKKHNKEATKKTRSKMTSFTPT